VSADKVEETDDVFLENLGTIEVIVLRCKDAPPPPPSEPVSRETSSRATVESSSRPTSKSTPKQSVHQEQKELAKPSSSSHKQKEPSAKAKAPSKPASAKPASAKAATAKESSVGGLFGLFDGASDEPDHDGINPKPYWNDWNKRPTLSSYRPARALYIAPEEPMPLVPKQAARARHVEHQVKTGKGAPYLHLCARPEYLDSMQQPYAVFTFKYRSKKVIEKKFKIEIREEGKALKAKLADMSKDELADELFKLRVSFTASICAGVTTVILTRRRWRRRAAAQNTPKIKQAVPPKPLHTKRPRTNSLRKATLTKCLPQAKHLHQPSQNVQRQLPHLPSPGMLQPTLLKLPSLPPRPIQSLLPRQLPRKLERRLDPILLLSLATRHLPLKKLLAITILKRVPPRSRLQRNQTRRQMLLLAERPIGTNRMPVERETGDSRTPVETKTGINSRSKTPPPGRTIGTQEQEQEQELLAVSTHGKLPHPKCRQKNSRAKNKKRKERTTKHEAKGRSREKCKRKS
jgi:hypothetical protein